jgi:hypothetical protein
LCFHEENIMAMNKARDQFDQRNSFRVARFAAVVLGVIAFSYLAGTLGQYPFPHSNAASAVAVEHANVDTGPASRAPDLRSSMPASSATDPRAENEGAKGLPRECDLRQGIDSTCIFN